MASKAEQISELEVAYVQFRDLFSVLPEEWFQRGGLGDWTLAELLAHMAGWYRAMAQELDEKTRTQLFVNILIAVILTAFCLRGLYLSADNWQRAGFVLAACWSWLAQRAGVRSLVAPALAGDSPLTTGLEFYRKELQRRRAYLRSPWFWFLGPVILAVGCYIPSAGRWDRMFHLMSPFLTLLLIWVVLYFINGHRESKALQRVLDALRALDK